MRAVIVALAFLAWGGGARAEPPSAGTEWHDFSGRHLETVFVAWDALRQSEQDLPPLSTMRVSYAAGADIATVYFFAPSRTFERDGRAYFEIGRGPFEVRVVDGEATIIPPAP